MISAFKTNKMKSFFLLILSLMLTGCETSSEVSGCPGGWVEFTCKCPKLYEGYNGTVVVDPRGTHIQSTQRDVWETKGNFSLYHDTKNKKLKVVIKQLQHEDFGQYRCKFYQEPQSLLDKEELRLVKERDGCHRQFNQTAYRTAKTTITCDHPGNKHESGVMFSCKENKKSICEDILFSPESNGTFSLTETNSSLSVSISNVSSEDAGVYWCGVKSKDGSYRTALRKIRLEVENITDFVRFPTVGQTFTFSCEYPKSTSVTKFVCKGEDPSTCKSLVSTVQRGNTGRFSIKDKKTGNMTVTVREVTTEDTGTYWCGDRSTVERRSNLFFSRIVMTVVPPPTVSTIPSATPSPSSVQPPTVSYGSLDHTSVLVIVAALSLDVLLLLLMLTAYFGYTRYETWKKTRRGL